MDCGGTRGAARAYFVGWAKARSAVPITLSSVERHGGHASASALRATADKSLCPPSNHATHPSPHLRPAPIRILLHVRGRACDGLPCVKHARQSMAVLKGLLGAVIVVGARNTGTLCNAIGRGTLQCATLAPDTLARRAGARCSRRHPRRAHCPALWIPAGFCCRRRQHHCRRRRDRWPQADCTIHCLAGHGDRDLPGPPRRARQRASQGACPPPDANRPSSPARGRLERQRWIWRRCQPGQRGLGRRHAGLALGGGDGWRHLLPQFRRAAAGRDHDPAEPRPHHPRRCVRRRAAALHRLPPGADVSGRDDGRRLPPQSDADHHHARRAREQPSRPSRRAHGTAQSRGLRRGASARDLGPPPNGGSR
ncbi:hypothetical protein ABIB83_006311 [Bradyrhizobium sp. I1.8.5]